MLITQAARDTHAELADRWSALDAWCAANTTAAAKVSASIKTFRDHWVEVDHGLRSDSDEVCGAYVELEAAESHAADVGYPLPARHGHFTACTPEGVARATLAGTSTVAPIVGVAVAAADYCDTHPAEAFCVATVPQDRSWCQRAGLPSAVCGPDGLDDWFLWALGLTGTVAAGGLAYITYQGAKVAAPLAIAAYAPEALPLYQAYRSGGASAAQPHVERLIAEQMNKGGHRG